MTGARTEIEIVLNGQPLRCEPGATLARLIELRRPQPPFAAEVNRQLVRRADYERTPLRAGDHVEIVTLVGGG